MSLRARLLSAVVIIALAAGLFAVSLFGTGTPGSASESLFSSRTTLNLWYSDADLTDYLNDAAVSYNNSQSKVRVEPKLMDAANYFQEINDASVQDRDLPDVFIIGNDSLGRAWLAGLASQVVNDSHFSSTQTYPQAALDAVTYEGNYVAYPLCFETGALLYNRDYLADMADAAGVAAGDAVPGTMVDIINMANSYDAPEEVSAVLKWDVSDIFYNYGFVGAYMDVGGRAGDNPDKLSVYNDKLISCMQVYQQLNSYFAIDTDTDDYEDVISDFADGRIVFAFATSDAVKTIRDRIAAGDSSIDYGVAAIPDSTAELATKTMSVTQCLVINGYSTHSAEAGDFIRYLLYQHMQDFYDRTGKPPAQAGYAYSDEHMNGFYDAYTDSVPITKLREASNFWMMLENAFSQVWNGADANSTLHDLDQQLMVQITGNEEYRVDTLPYPEPVNISSELTGMD